MCSKLSIVLFIVTALVLCGCATQRTSKEPFSYRQRANPPPSATAVGQTSAPVARPQPKPEPPAVSRPASGGHESARAKADSPVGAKSVVYRREDARPQAKETLRGQPSDASLGKLQGVRPEPKRKAPPVESKRNDSHADNAKLKALYDSGFLTREEYLRAKNGK